MGVLQQDAVTGLRCLALETLALALRRGSTRAETPFVAVIAFPARSASCASVSLCVPHVAWRCSWGWGRSPGVRGGSTSGCSSEAASRGDGERAGPCLYLY